MRPQRKGKRKKESKTERGFRSGFWFSDDSLVTPPSIESSGATSQTSGRTKVESERMDNRRLAHLLSAGIIRSLAFPPPSPSSPCFALFLPLLPSFTPSLHWVRQDFFFRRPTPRLVSLRPSHPSSSLFLWSTIQTKPRAHMSALSHLLASMLCMGVQMSCRLDVSDVMSSLRASWAKLTPPHSCKLSSSDLRKDFRST